MSVFIPDDKKNLIDQLNALNGTTVSPTDVTIVQDGTGQKITGIEPAYTGDVSAEMPKRDFAKLFPRGAFLKLAGVPAGNVTGTMLLGLLNEQYHLELSESIFESTDLSVGVALDTTTQVSCQLALRAKTTDPFWTGTLYLSAYLQFPENYTPRVVTSSALTLTAAQGPVVDYKLTGSNKTINCTLQLAGAGANRINWLRVISVAAATEADTGLFINWNKFVPDDDTVTLPNGLTTTPQYFVVYTFDQWKTYRIRSITAEEAKQHPMHLALGWASGNGLIEVMGQAHDVFLTLNTGTFVNPKTDHFVFNQDNVLVNNRHFIRETRQESQPDGDATTEGQSLFILGAAIFGDAVSGTGATTWLNRAKVAYDAYIDAFYAGLQPPTTPGRWICNWIVNGKQPVLAHYPLAVNDFPTHGGFHATEIAFVNGVGQLPHDTPTFGEYTDLVSQVYIGALGWPNLNADAYKQKGDGSIDWTTRGVNYEIEKVGLWTLKFVDMNGDVVGDCTAEQVGQIVLKDKTVNVTAKVAWAPRVPVEKGGYLIATNECQHNRPIQVPVTRDFMGNASDAEQWFCEAAWTLWIKTGEEKYKQAFKASQYTIEEYTQIDALDKFFRQVIGTDRYDTDGISYTYFYPSNTPVVIDRDELGYIRGRAEVAVQSYFEQNALPFRVTRESKLHVTYGGKDDAGRLVNFSASLTLSIDKSTEKGRIYSLVLPASEEVVSVDVPIGSLIPADALDIASDPMSGSPGAGLKDYEVPVITSIDWSSNCTNTNQKVANVVDTRTATTLLSTATAAGQQLDINLKKQAPITKLTYRGNLDYNIRVSDANGWRWWAMVPANANWTQLDLSSTSLWSLSGYQPDGTGERPTSYVPGLGPTYYTILPDDDSVEGSFIEIYCVNALPPADAETPGEVVEDPVSGSVLIKLEAVSWSENNVTTMAMAEGLPNGRTAIVLNCEATGAGQQIQITSGALQVVRQIIYKSNLAYNVRVEDEDGWRWWAMLPVAADWTTQRILRDDWSLSSYQPNHADTDVRPDDPNFGAGTKDIIILPDDESIAGSFISIHAINLVPDSYNVDDGYTILFTLKATLEGPGTFRIGDCTILNQRQDPLPYTPGLIPFSNNYVPNAPTFDGWHGQPYPGYQHPWVFLDSDDPNRDLMINNVIQFWVDSQDWYHNKFGIWGPGASAYVWDRWDAPSGLEPNTFTMYHFGTQDAWSGYQPRAFFSAVRLYAGLKERNRAVPEGLVTYISRWMDFLYTFMTENDGVSPTDFPMETVPKVIPNDFTGHMAGLWLAGCSLAMMHDFPNEKGFRIAHMVFKEIRENMVNNYLVKDVMNGSWSPFSDPSNLGKDGMFFGFWSGEILRGLGYYHSLLSGVPSSLIAYKQ